MQYFTDLTSKMGEKGEEIKKKTTIKTLSDTDNSLVITGGTWGWWRVEEGKRGQMVMDGDLIWGDELPIQYTDDVLYNCTPETYKKDKE